MLVHILYLVVLLASRSICWCLRVDWLPLVGHLSHKPPLLSGCVGGCLDPSVRQGNNKGTLHVALEQRR